MPQTPVGNSFEWREWFFALYSKFANNGSGISFNSLDFSNSNIDNIVIRNHNTLSNIQGGDSLNRYHLTVNEYATVQNLSIGISATITTAKLTTGGANGSMTFTNGILTAQTQAT